MKPILLLLILALPPAEAIASHGDLHCIVVDVPRGELMLVREEVRLSSIPIAGENPELFSTNGHPRDLIFRGHASVLEKTRVDMGKGGKGASPAERGPNEPGITLTVQKMRGERGMEFRYDASVLLLTKNGGYHRFATGDQRVPLKFNHWQEVATWAHGNRIVMLWQFMESRDDPFPDPSQPPAEAPANGPVDVKGNYRIDVAIGTLAKQVVELAVGHPPKLAQLTLEQFMNGYNEWKVYSLHCHSGEPFFSQSSVGELKRMAEPNYDENSTATLDGIVTLRENRSLTFEAKLKAPKEQDGPLEVYSFAGESTVGAWKFISFPEGPMYKLNLPYLPDWYPQMAARVAQSNVIAFRVVQMVD